MERRGGERRVERRRGREDSYRRLRTQVSRGWEDEGGGGRIDGNSRLTTQGRKKFGERGGGWMGDLNHRLKTQGGGDGERDVEGGAAIEIAD